MREKIKKAVDRVIKADSFDHHQNTTELVKAIERKDKRFRFFQTVFMVGTFVLLILVISAQQRTIDGIDNQITEARAERTKQSDANQARTETILRRLDCLAVYFSQSSRAGLTIANIDKCTLNREGDVQQFFTQDNDGNIDVTPNQQETGTPPNLTPSTPPQQSGGATTPIEQPPVVEPRPPILNLPLLEIPNTCLLGLLCVE